MSNLAYKAALVAALAGLAGNAAASTFHFEPKNGGFTASGSVTITAAAVSLPCTTTLTGSVVSGHAHITGASFSGVSCAVLSANHLPWRLEAKSDHSFAIKHMEVGVVGIGVCGPRSVRAKLSVNGTIGISGADLTGRTLPVPCSVSGTLQTTPHITIAN